MLPTGYIPLLPNHFNPKNDPYFSCLSDEVIFHIFSYLPSGDIQTIPLVSIRFKRLSIVSRRERENHKAAVFTRALWRSPFVDLKRYSLQLKTIDEYVSQVALAESFVDLKKKLLILRELIADLLSGLEAHERTALKEQIDLEYPLFFENIFFLSDHYAKWSKGKGPLTLEVKTWLMFPRLSLNLTPDALHEKTVLFHEAIDMLFCFYSNSDEASCVKNYLTNFFHSILVVTRDAAYQTSSKIEALCSPEHVDSEDLNKALILFECTESLINKCYQLLEFLSIEEKEYSLAILAHKVHEVASSLLVYQICKSCPEDNQFENPFSFLKAALFCAENGKAQLARQLVMRAMECPLAIYTGRLSYILINLFADIASYLYQQGVDGIAGEVRDQAVSFALSLKTFEKNAYAYPTSSSYAKIQKQDTLNRIHVIFSAEAHQLHGLSLLTKRLAAKGYIDIETINLIRNRIYTSTVTLSIDSICHRYSVYIDHLNVILGFLDEEIVSQNYLSFRDLVSQTVESLYLFSPPSIKAYIYPCIVSIFRNLNRLRHNMLEDFFESYRERSMFDQAKEMAVIMHLFDLESGDHAFSVLAKDLASLGNIGSAFELVSKIQDRGKKAATYRQLAKLRSTKTEETVRAKKRRLSPKPDSK